MRNTGIRAISSSNSSGMPLDRIRRNTRLVVPLVFALQSKRHDQGWNGKHLISKGRKRKMNKMNKMMNDLLLKVYIKAQILNEDSGQDLVEYSLIAALIAFGTVAGMNG